MVKKPKAKAEKKPTPKQRNFLKLVPQIAQGKLTVEQALLRAGYAKSSARQQQEVMKGLRQSSVMQRALKEAGFTEEFLAETVFGDIRRLRPGVARRTYLEMGAKLLDAFPATKNLHALTEPDELLDKVEAEAEYAP